MLARSGRMPTRGDWSYEVKWDGFRAVVSTEHRFRVRSRRGWDMTLLLPELAALPVYAPDFPLICERMLMRQPGIAITYVIFDLLSLDGNSLLRAPYFERRAQLEALELDGAYWQTPDTFDDGPTLFEAVARMSSRVSSRSDAAGVTGSGSAVG
jgi:bifunctional non-homologous end joining protein LigD